MICRVVSRGGSKILHLRSSIMIRNQTSLPLLFTIQEDQDQKKEKKEKQDQNDQKEEESDPENSEEEEKLFLEAVELHGRAWHKCVEHMKHTRTKQSFTSHAQKHFIKLYRDDISLPAKVEESGAGYTLSGKPLDKDSAAARAYGASGAESQASYRKMIKLRKADPKTVMLEMARCNIIQFGKKIQVFEVFKFIFTYSYLFFSVFLSLHTYIHVLL